MSDQNEDAAAKAEEVSQNDTDAVLASAQDEGSPSEDPVSSETVADTQATEAPAVRPGLFAGATSTNMLEMSSDAPQVDPVEPDAAVEEPSAVRTGLFGAAKSKSMIDQERDKPVDDPAFQTVEGSQAILSGEEENEQHMKAARETAQKALSGGLFANVKQASIVDLEAKHSREHADIIEQDKKALEEAAIHEQTMALLSDDPGFTTVDVKNAKIDPNLISKTPWTENGKIVTDSLKARDAREAAAALAEAAQGLTGDGETAQSAAEHLNAGATTEAQQEAALSDDFPTYEAVDGLHADMMSSLLAARQSALGENRAKVKMTEEQRKALEEQINADAAMRQQDAQRQGPPSVLGSLAGLFQSDPSGKLRKEHAKITADSIRGSAFGERVVNQQFRQMTNAADSMYRSFADLDSKVKDFNQKFATSADGRKFLDALDYVADRRKISVSTLREHLNDLSNHDPKDTVLMKLRHRQDKLCKSPEFQKDLQEINMISDKMRRNGKRFAADLQMLKRNGVDFAGIEDLGTKLAEGMKIDDPLLSKPGEAGKLSKAQDDLKKMVDHLRKVIEGFFKTLTSLFSRSSSAA
ncbi:hypothetical protein ACFOY8_12165 [Thalassospira xianhensis]|uniref:Uncharacterized protein n=1 Tax=Thalassospira xianhensis MCCC 1A02616 TaxID=1177929 RepID=A0A367UEH0_9PROT|nr:hypothetical protein [Thalassospira xianhensis]RCK06380.1 hypothetical protein TH5_09295 [Thalassospira xianhensis MCCC 1A02616]